MSGWQQEVAFKTLRLAAEAESALRQYYLMVASRSSLLGALTSQEDNATSDSVLQNAALEANEVEAAHLIASSTMRLALSRQMAWQQG